MPKAQNNPWKQPTSQPLGLAQSALRALGLPCSQPQKFATLRPGEYIENLPITKQFVAGILQHTQNDFVASPGQLQTLTENSERFEAIFQKMVYWSQDKTHDRVREAEKNIANLPEDVRLQTQADARAEALLRRRALKDDLRKITLETTEIATEICGRIQSAAADFAKSREKQERAEAEKFGIEFQPSAVLATAMQASWRIVEALPDPCLRQSPAQILKTLPIDLLTTK
jgi:hypothetical protein